MSAPVYYLQATRRYPPKELQYDGWQYEKINDGAGCGYEYTIPQYWVLLTRKAVPKDLRISGWDTDKFVYKRV